MKYLKSLTAGATLSAGEHLNRYFGTSNLSVISETDVDRNITPAHRQHQHLYHNGKHLLFSGPKYITNGLSFYFDGMHGVKYEQNKTTNIIKPVDLISNTIFTQKDSITDSWASVQTYLASFYAAHGEWYSANINSTSSLITDNCTIEVCVKPTQPPAQSGKYESFVFAMNNCIFSFFMSSTINTMSVITESSEKTKYNVLCVAPNSTNWVNEYMCVQVRGGGHYDSFINGNKMQKHSVSDYFSGNATSNEVTIGARNNTSRPCYFVGNIYAIRVYNRILSVDECEYNRKIDNLRFNNTSSNVLNQNSSKTEYDSGGLIDIGTEIGTEIDKGELVKP